MSTPRFKLTLSDLVVEHPEREERRPEADGPAGGTPALRGPQSGLEILGDLAAEIVFDDGGMNLLSSSALEELSRTIGRIPRTTRILFFHSGHESVFAAGADMQEMAAFDPEDARRFSTLGQELLERIEQLPMVTVALVDGDCFGGALDLTLAFDVRIASLRSRFSHPGGRIGIVTGFGGTSRWRHALAPAAARRLFLGNVVFGAADALTVGLVDEVVERFDGRERELALAFLARSPSEVALVRDIMRIPRQLCDRDYARFARHLGALHLGAEIREL